MLSLSITGAKCHQACIAGVGKSVSHVEDDRRRTIEGLSVLVFVVDGEMPNAKGVNIFLPAIFAEYNFPPVDKCKFIQSKGIVVL